MATVKLNYAEIIARTTRRIEDTRNELEKYEAKGLDAVAEITREKIKNAEQFVEQLKKNLQAKSRQRVPKDFTASAPPAYVIQLFNNDFSSGILPDADESDEYVSFSDNESKASDVASEFDFKQSDDPELGFDGLSDTKKPDYYSASEKIPGVDRVAVAVAEELNNPVAAKPPKNSRKSQRITSSRKSRKPESLSSDPLRYSAAALGIRVMSAAESAGRAAVEAADAERRANFFRANGLAP